MGGASSKQTIQNYVENNTNISSIINTAFNSSATSTTNQSCTNLQKTVMAGATFKNCTVTISDICKIDVKVINSLSATATAQLSTDIANNFSTSIINSLKNDKSLDWVQEALRIFNIHGTEETATTSIKNHINEVVSKSITTNTVANTINNTTIKQALNNDFRNITCDSSTFNFTLDGQITQITSTLVTSVSNALVNDSIVNDLYNKINSSVENKDESVISKFFDTIGTAGIILLSIVLLLFLLIGGLIVLKIISSMFKSGSQTSAGQAPPQTASGTGGKRVVSYNGRVYEI